MTETEHDLSTIGYCRIHPAVGIARLGNSPEEYFLGSEVPGCPAEPDDKLFKDNEGRVKRQGVRFRIYAYGPNDNVLKELTADDCSITWNVHLANKKGEHNLFRGRFKPTNERRNSDIVNRKDLIIDPGPRSISGTNESGDKYKFDTGKFLGVTVPLGEASNRRKRKVNSLGRLWKIR